MTYLSAPASWPLIRVSADELSSKNCFWLSWDMGIEVVGKTSDGRDYEIVTPTSCVPHLRCVALGVNFAYDPTTPTEEDASTYGV